MIEIVNADAGHIRAVLERLRELDAKEMAAGAIDLDKLPGMIMRHKVFAFCAWSVEDGPVAIWGMVPRRPGVGAGFAFGTDRWGAALIPMLRQIKGFVLPFLVASDYHRVEAAALALRFDVASFMELIGAEAEGILRGYGTNGEDFISYRWLADEYCQPRAAFAETHHSHASH